jgi:sec-independent protein translocase protein TatC
MSDNPEDNVMTFWEHLEELRGRMVRMILAFVVGGGLAWYFKAKLLIWLTKPYVIAWNNGPHQGVAALHFPAPAALFLAYVRLAATGGAIFALPIVLYQVWAFIAPGLYSREKRFAIPFVVSSCGLFAAGGYFGWKVAFPVAFQYLLSFSGKLADGPNGIDLTPTVMVSDYIDFVTHMLIAFGVAFELPVLSFFLSFAGIVTYKQLIKFFRYFIVVAFIISAVLTPPDPMSQLLLAIPLCGLYGVSILVAWIFGRKPEPVEPAT